MQNIIMRFGMRHSLNFLLPKAANYLGYHAPITDGNLDEAAVPVDRKFNIFTHHSRYRAATNIYLYEDAIKVTTLRDPPELFESVYYYYNLNSYYKMSLPQLLSTLPNKKTAFVRKKFSQNGYNQMSFDLGLNENAFENETAVREFIAYIDQEFDFVMITEYLDASLVMLADLMCWPLHYVTSLPLLTRAKYFRYKLTAEDRTRLSELNNADTLLYNYFLEKFRSRIIQYGLSRLLEDVQRLYTMNENLANRCISGKDFSGHGNTVSYHVLKNLSDWECLYSTKQELRFTDELRYWQVNKLRNVKKIYEFVNKSDRN